MKKYQAKNLSLYQTDCLSLLKSLADDSVDLIATDPPYYKVKTESWDNQWKDKKAFFDWLDQVLCEYHRVLKPTGSLYLFAGPHLATQVELAVARRFKLLNHIIWRKENSRHKGCCKEALRRYFPQTEHIMFASSKKPVPFVYEPIRAYLDTARIDAGVSRAEVDKACGCQMSGHWFGRSQWSLPSEQHYKTMAKLFRVTFKPYAELKAQYKAIKSILRPFNVTKHVPYTNVWDFDTVAWYPGKHPCEKPLALMRHIVETSSLPGDVVLDTFMGSGSTAIACRETDRRFIGCEMGEGEFDMAVGRLDLV